MNDRASNDSEQNKKHGIRILRDEAQRGDVVSQLTLSMNILTGKVPSEHDLEGLNLAFKAADSGYVPAMVYLGSLYEEGLGVQRNEQTAFGWYLRAAESQDGDSAAKIGIMFKDGTGTTKDEEKALEWLLTGARLNSHLAHKALSLTYRMGDLGQAKNPLKAKEHSAIGRELFRKRIQNERSRMR